MFIVKKGHQPGVYVPLRALFLVANKFYLKHHWGGGKAALGFWPDRIGTLVSMATDSSNRVIMGKT